MARAMARTAADAASAQDLRARPDPVQDLREFDRSPGRRYGET